MFSYLYLQESLLWRREQWEGSMGRVRWSRPPEFGIVQYFSWKQDSKLNTIWFFSWLFSIKLSLNIICPYRALSWNQPKSRKCLRKKSAFMTQSFRFPAGNMLSFSWKETKSGENVWERTTSETWKLVCRCLLSGFQKPPSDRAAFAGIQSSRLHQTKWGRI